MTMARRIVGLFTLTIYLGGCSYYKDVSPQHQIEKPGALEEQTLAVKLGDRVRITFLDQTEVTGKVHATARESVSIELTNNYEVYDAPEIETGVVQIPFASIQSIEKKATSIGDTAVLVLVIIGLMVSAAMAFPSSSGPIGPSFH